MSTSKAKTKATKTKSTPYRYRVIVNLRLTSRRGTDAEKRDHQQLQSLIEESLSIDGDGRFSGNSYGAGRANLVFEVRTIRAIRAEVLPAVKGWPTSRPADVRVERGASRTLDRTFTRLEVLGDDGAVLRYDWREEKA